MGNITGQKNHQATACRLDVVSHIVLEVHAQLAAMLGQPGIVEVKHRRHHVLVIIAKAIHMPEVAGTRWIQRKMAFVVLQPQEKAAIERLTQAFHQFQIAVATLHLPRFKPLNAVTTNAFAYFLRCALANSGRLELAFGSTFSALLLKFKSQSFGQENILLRPAVGGQVVDDSQQQWVVRGYAHGVHSIDKP